MANQWFKFYGGEYLCDPKILQLNSQERSCWITLMCLASQTKDGTIKFLSEKQLLLMSGVTEDISVIKKFEEMEMIEVCNGNVTLRNWLKRQLSESVIRVRDYRLKQKCNGNVTTEEKRIEENREERKTPPHKKVSYLKEIPEEDLKEFVNRFDVSPRDIKNKAESLLLYCQSKGKVYKDYKAFLLNAVKKDFPERKTVKKVEQVDVPKLSPEEIQKINARKEEIRNMLSLKK